MPLIIRLISSHYGLFDQDGRDFSHCDSLSNLRKIDVIGD
jgi:hypothetical protein